MVIMRRKYLPQKHASRTTVVGAGTPNFWFQVSSEVQYDGLKWYRDGPFRRGWSGNKAWSPESIEVPGVTHIIKWQYEKDGSLSAPQDCAWVDKEVFTRYGGIAPVYQFLLLDSGGRGRSPDLIRPQKTKRPGKRLASCLAHYAPARPAPRATPP